jgi:hypothetical protein
MSWIKTDLACIIRERERERERERDLTGYRMYCIKSQMVPEVFLAALMEIKKYIVNCESE